MSRWQRNLLLVLALLAILIILPGIPWLYFDLTYSNQLAGELDALRAQGAPLTLAEAAPKPVPADRNAATLYMPLFRVNFDPAHPQYKDQGTQHGLNRYETPDGWKSGEWESAERMRPVLALPGCQAALRTLREASLRPACVFPVQWGKGPATLFPHLAQLRQATRLCAAQAMLDAKDGHAAAAVDWLGVCYRLASHAGQEPTLIAQLVEIAMLALTNKSAQAVCDVVPVTPELAAALRAHLDRVPVAANFTHGMLGERAMGLDCFRMIERNGVNGSEIAELLGVEDSGTAVFVRVMGAGVTRPYWKLEKLNYLRYMTHAVERSQQPHRLTAGQPEGVKPALGRIMSTMLVPVLGKANGKRDEALAQLDLLRLGLDLKLYQRAHGQYPATLAALGAKRPVDIFTGKDFVYQRQAQGFKLYSVGINRKDDKGVGYLRGTGPGGSGSATDDITWECAR